MQAIETATIERAFVAIKKTKLVPDDGLVSSEVMGYVSSFGAAVIQAGLVAAIIFFSEKGGDDDAKYRPKLIEALHHMLGAPESTLLDHARANQNALESLEERLLENAIALKMALRSYEKIKPQPR